MPNQICSIFKALTLPALLLIATVVFGTGIGWGLPTRAEDRFLFASPELVWPAEEILELSQVDEEPPGQRASDVDVNPVDRSRIVLLNSTDEQRAEIIRRYRLFSYQPDEMQTMMALAQINPGERQFDPRMYKYGGLWIYPVGAILKAASMLGLVELRSDLAYYVDDPKAFGRFYIAARAYTVFWALIGVCAVWWIARRLAPPPGTPEEDVLSAFVAAVCFIFMPVVMTMAHEAKPHLPGAVLILLTAVAGIRYLDSDQRKWLWITGALAGAATGMVPSAWVAFLVLVSIAVMRRGKVARVVAASVIGIVVYVLTNPFVAINLLVNREVLASNLGNTAAFYHVGWDAIPNAARLVRAGMSSPLAIASFVAVVALSIGASRNREMAANLRPSWLVAVPAIVSGVQFVVFAAAQPPDYARFALSANIALMLATILAVGWLIRLRWARALVLVAILIPTVICGGVVLRGFVRDSQSVTTRLLTAGELEKWKLIGARRLVVLAEPAPYAVPPVDLFHWEILLMPTNADFRHVEVGDVVIYVDNAGDDPFGPSISWADKRFVIRATPRFLGVDNGEEISTMP